MSETNPADYSAWSKRLPKHPVIDRNDYIAARCSGKHVVHLGATDAPFAVDKARRGQLLHQRLAKGSASLCGIDYDAESIAALRDQFSISDIQCVDLSKVQDNLGITGDIVVCGDIIEHVNNVGDLMINCNRLTRDGGELIVSTINALAFKPATRAFFGREAVHHDHVAYYSHSTLGVMLLRHGYVPVETRYFAYGTVTRVGNLFTKLLFRVAPALADGVLVLARKVKSV